MTLSEPVKVRARPEHLAVLDVFCMAHEVPRSTAIRMLIERWARSIKNAQLLDAVPEELHDQLPDMWSTALSSPDTFDVAAWAESVALLESVRVEVEE